MADETSEPPESNRSIMDPQAFERLQDLFERARGLSEQQQVEFVKRELGDEPRVFQELEKLLARDRAQTPPPGDEPPPEHIGPYKVLDVLGSGGMGTVYKAEQKTPVRRLVAIKVIKLGLDSREVVARFDLERRALAAMSHQCIAKVFEAGTTERGQPYFVMELVQGLPLTRYCDKHRLELKERVHLFQQVCAGVQHAHQKGVIHRDLKPGNIVVMREDDKAVPKILDFGLAKATNRELLTQTVYTERERIIGTPEYMSPEQAASDEDAIDVRADIYSLGVVLYELLAGVLPFSSDELRRAGWLEMQRILADVDPPKPSTKLTAAAGAATEFAQRRRTSLSHLHHALRGDLDWIVLKALAKEPERRYGSATALAEDLQRHLEYEPVLAGPPSTAYRLKKFLRKRRGPVAAGVAVFLALVGGLAAAMWQADVARTAEAKERQARLDEEKERKRAELAKQTAKENEQTAKENESQAKRNLALADARLADYQRMKDAPFCDDLLKEVEKDLWPAHPGKVEAMDDWLRRAGELIAREAGHRRKLEELRAKALPRLPEVQSRIDELRTLEKERDAKRARRDRFKAAASRSAAARRQLPVLEKELSEAESRVEKLDAELRDKRWIFESYEDRFLHGVFADLVAKIERMRGDDGLVARMRARRQRAATLGVRSLEDAKDDWRQAIERVVKNRKYRGMPALEPQLGLAPLGSDPDSKLEEFAVLDTGAVPERDASDELQIDGGSAIVLVLIPPALAGTFSMGAQKNDKQNPNYDPQAEDDESPVREVLLDAFFMSKYEMTQGQWERLMGQNPSASPHGTWDVTRQNPVENVSWNDCTEAMRRLGLELPTEAQWEYATRAGTSTAWWTGMEKLSLAGAANLADKSCKDRLPAYDAELEDDHVIHAAVGSFRANAFGLHDVIGNVWEWCRDEYGDYAQDPRPGNGLRFHRSARDRVFRGGSWRNVARFARSADRYWYRAEFRGSHLGCRPSRGLITR